MRCSCALFSGLSRLSTVPAGSFANAASVGANTVNGPVPFSVSTRSAALSAAASVLNEPAATAVSTMSLSARAEVVVDAPRVIISAVVAMANVLNMWSASPISGFPISDSPIPRFPDFPISRLPVQHRLRPAALHALPEQGLVGRGEPDESVNDCGQRRHLSKAHPEQRSHQIESGDRDQPPVGGSDHDQHSSDDIKLFHHVSPFCVFDFSALLIA